MKMSKKLIQAFLSAVFLLIVCSIPAYAASCTCQNGKPHDASSHMKDYVSNGDSGHTVLCYTCMLNGHTADCEQVILDKEEAHDLAYTGTGANRKAACRKCDYEGKACDHKNAKGKELTSTVGGPRTDEDTCYIYCDDCDQIVETTKHVIKYEQMEKAYNAHRTTHIAVCKVCGYNYYNDKTVHTWKVVSYKKPKTPKNPITDVTKNDSAAAYHTVNVVCKQCNFKTTLTEEHKFKSNKCTKCKLSKEILPKVSSLKGKQKGKSKHSVVTVKAAWVWSGNQWNYYKSRKIDLYKYKVTANWKKNKKAYGYYWTLNKADTKRTGTYLTNRDITNTGGRYGFTKKTTASYALDASKKLKSSVFYVAPISKYGFIGKFQKVTVKLK